MKPVKLKVCGITTFEDAEAAVACGADYLGFNFYPPSPRYISPERAREIIDRLQGDVQTVGVFVNEQRPDDVTRIMVESGVQLAQLHGDESAAYCAAIGAHRVIKAIRVTQDFEPVTVLDYKTAAVLLDAHDESLYGGTGKKTDWNLARAAAQLTHVILAGGLAPHNIAEAIRTVMPFGVDVNSGVESSPGRKDAAKLRLLKKEIEAWIGTS